MTEYNAKQDDIYIPVGKTLRSQLANPDSLPGNLDIMYVGENDDGNHIVRLFMEE